MEPVRVEVKLNEQDIYEFQKSFLFRRLTLRQCVAIYGLFAIFVVLQIVIDGVYSPSTSKHLLMLAMPVVVVGILVFFVKKTAKDMIKTGKLFEKATTYELTKDFIGYSAETGSGSFRWSDLYKLKETNHCFLMYTSKQQALILPKRYMDETGVQEAVRTLCEESPTGLEVHNPWKLFAIGAFIMSASILVMIWVLISSKL